MSELIKRVIHDKWGIVIGIILSALMFYLFYTFYQSRQRTVVVTDAYSSYIVNRGKSFLLCRNVEYKKPTKIEIVRALVQQKNVESYDIDFPKIFVKRNKGTYRICREIYVPKLINSGEWALETTLVKHTPPLWRFAYKIKPVHLYIKE